MTTKPTIDLAELRERREGYPDDMRMLCEWVSEATRLMEAVGEEWIAHGTLPFELHRQMNVLIAQVKRGEP